MSIQIQKTSKAGLALRAENHNTPLWRGVSVIIKVWKVAVIFMAGKEVK